eukprot:snap_masked-scaffold575_size133042-processed-gene-0.4 protein:Tk10150 transcript:snap_masked-scaffold575_size133042-processed-gene-0.4-mRNA-1 annotation:"hypothetical protein AaeL_AAEL001403"
MSVMATLMGWMVVSGGFQVALAINCYECDSAQNFTCTEFWDTGSPVVSKYLTDCSHVHDAKYCVKMNGIFDGKLGTTRFCSSKDWGTYCEYIQRPGDIQEYRSCVFTCWAAHGCNQAHASAASRGILLTSLAISLMFGYRLSGPNPNRASIWLFLRKIWLGKDWEPPLPLPRSQTDSKLSLFEIQFGPQPAHKHRKPGYLSGI